MKTAIITGAARGIGKEIARKFAEQGINIALNYRSEEPVEFIRYIEACGVECLPYQADISDFTKAEEFIKAVKERFRTIDYLINNAGITADGLIMRMSEENFDRVIDVNLKGAFNMIRHVSGIMLKQKSGSIVNITSVVGIQGNAGQANYAASKAGLIGLTKTVAKELASRGITANAVAPGFIETDMTGQLPDSIKQEMLQNIPLKRYGKPEEVADLVYFLVMNKYITGQVISIDGGMTA